MSGNGLAHRLYRGDAGLNIVGRRKIFYGVSLLILVIALISIFTRGFTLGIDFKGGDQIQVPASAGVSLTDAKNAVSDAGAVVVSGQRVGGSHPTYLIRTEQLSADKASAVKSTVSRELKVPANQISDSRVSKSWGGQITQKALIALAVFLALVVLYLIIRFEWRMAIGAFVALIHDLLLAATVYSLVGWEVTPNTVIGLLTILGFSLYDVVVVFDKVQENTRSITGGTRYTYPEAANLAVNQTLMRSINTALIALLPVAGLLFIGAGLLGAGTLKELGLVLFVGMLSGVYSSIFIATPVLVDLKMTDPKYRNHEKRVLARRAGTDGSNRSKKRAAREAAAAAEQEPAAAGEATDGEQDTVAEPDGETSRVLAGASAPRPGARPGNRQQAKRRSSGKGGTRPGGGKRRH
jgi:preprotein translocase subunit SecF